MRRLMLAVLILAALGGPAWAEEDQDLAKQFFVLGDKLYRRGDYEGALANFQKAYKYSQKPELVFNIARCNELLGNLEAAIQFYTEYLKSDPPNAEILKARVENLRLRAAKGTPVKEPGPSSQAMEASPTSASPTSAPPASAPASGQEPVTPTSRPLRLPGWILVGAGGALLVTGALLGWQASVKAKEIDDASRSVPRVSFEDCEDTERAGKGLQTGAIISLAVGGAAAAAGAVLLILDSRGKRAERAAWLAPTVTPRGAALAGGIRF